MSNEKISEGYKVRPAYTASMSAAEFDSWYWSKEELLAFCEQFGLPTNGAKETLRLRLMAELPGGKPVVATKSARANPKTFDWAGATLSGTTVITPDVRFGPNFRNFMKMHIGMKFQCHGDFMNWVKDNPGKTLKEAVLAWQQLEARKKIPGFRRDIAVCNNYLRYLRDFQDDNPKRSYEEGKTCWQHKKLQPAQAGYVVYSKRDLDFL